MRKQTSKTLWQYHTHLLSLLNDLEGVIQPPKFHPESDALYHSLQVFELAYHQSTDPELWAAALFHDIGKSVDQKNHASIGADMVHSIFPQRVEWLIYHHLDLLKSPTKTRHKLAGTSLLKDLTTLRNWDMNGRSQFATVMTAEEALELVLNGLGSDA
ncbi:tRNA nucleotidyltransferase [Hahella sp. CCB-MM4]|uniref:HD domain-containing protein n=1 Tax=Hahella sp. (strain CCB-MM4) TaxID=1926491 RepID=UPI000B9B0696|nr:HD domain-containing protein [Hahella sp. CCB-MM4]OZG71559.1 tRNA nucleotidyltransferase [Hahella sp. CCB-MM4]